MPVGLPAVRSHGHGHSSCRGCSGGAGVSTAPLQAHLLSLLQVVLSPGREASPALAWRLYVAPPVASALFFSASNTLCRFVHTVSLSSGESVASFSFLNTRSLFFPASSVLPFVSWCSVSYAVISEPLSFIDTRCSGNEPVALVPTRAPVSLILSPLPSWVQNSLLRPVYLFVASSLSLACCRAMHIRSVIISSLLPLC